MSLKNPSLGLRIRLPIEKVPLKSTILVSPKEVSTDLIEGNGQINWLIIGT